MQSFLETVGLTSPETTSTTMSTTTSQIRQNFHDDSIDRINKLINTYMTGAYGCMYLEIRYFTRDDVALNNIARYFEIGGKIKCWKAKQLIKYMNQRGGRVVFNDITTLKKTEWDTSLEAFEYLLEYQKNVNKELLDLHTVATKNNDYQLCDFIETEFLHDMVKHLEELGWICTNLRRVGKGVGEYVFDEQYFKNLDKVGHTLKWLTEHMKKLDVNDSCVGTVGTTGIVDRIGDLILL